MKRSKSDRPSGFIRRSLPYSLHISCNDSAWVIPFEVDWQGTERKTEWVAVHTSTSIWAIAIYGAECEAYPIIEKALGAETIKAILEIHQSIQEKYAAGRLRNPRNELRTTFVTHEWMDSNIRVFDPARNAAQLLS